MEGCCLAVEIRDTAGNRDPLTVVVLYIPPKCSDVIDQLDSATAPRGQIVLAGDINIQLQPPRDAQEREDARELIGVLE